MCACECIDLHASLLTLLEITTAKGFFEMSPLENPFVSQVEGFNVEPSVERVLHGTKRALTWNKKRVLRRVILWGEPNKVFRFYITAFIV